MQIQSGNLYENRTWKYLYPSLKRYGPRLLKELSLFFKLGVGIGDYNMTGEKYGNCLFILVDTNIQFNNSVEIENYKSNFSKFLDWVSYEPFYVDDYIYEGMGGSEKHMVVIRIPADHDKSYMHFIRGQYSQMYKQREINEYFQYINILNKDIEEVRNNKIENTRYILFKDSDYLEDFLTIVCKDFGEKVDKIRKYYLNAELDYPPKLQEEIFNYKK